MSAPRWRWRVFDHPMALKGVKQAHPMRIVHAESVDVSGPVCGTNVQPSEGALGGDIPVGVINACAVCLGGMMSALNSSVPR